MEESLMKKLLVVIFLMLALFANQSYSQKMGASVGAELSLPMGTFGDMAGFGFGGSGRFEYSMGPTMTLMGTVGYLMWGEKEKDLGFAGKYKYKFSGLKIMAGAKYSFGGGLYGSAELGIYSLSSKATIPGTTFFGVTTPSTEVTASSSEFIIAPGIGYNMGSIDLGAWYGINSNAGHLGVRVAYAFGL